MGKHVKSPTLGEIAEELHELKERGVSLESLIWVATQRIWWEEQAGAKVYRTPCRWCNDSGTECEHYPADHPLHVHADCCK